MRISYDREGINVTFFTGNQAEFSEESYKAGSKTNDYLL